MVKFPAKKDFPPPLKTGGKISHLLQEGLTLKKIARLTGNSYKSIYKKAKKYERAGLIEPISKYPLIYRRKKSIFPPLKLVGDFTPADQLQQPGRAVILPHKMGASFIMLGRPNLKYNNRGKHTIKELDHTVQFGRHKAQIWLKAFVGTEVDEILHNAKNRLLQLAQAYESSFAIKLTLNRIYQDIEWADTSRARSKKIAQKAGIEDGGRIRVGNTEHKFGDHSHPFNLEINNAPGAPPHSATIDARTHIYLYTRLPADIERIGKTLDKITDSIVSINTGLKALEQRVKK